MHGALATVQDEDDGAITIVREQIRLLRRAREVAPSLACAERLAADASSGRP